MNFCCYFCYDLQIISCVIDISYRPLNLDIGSYVIFCVLGRKTEGKIICLCNITSIFPYRITLCMKLIVEQGFSVCNFECFICTRCLELCNVYGTVLVENVPLEDGMVRKVRFVESCK